MPRGVYKYILMIVPDKAHGGIRMSANIKILIVDDDVYIGDMVAAALTKQGYEPVRAYSGTEALLVLEGTKPDVILLDLMLPGLNGEELIKRIKDIPVIVVSAKVGIDDKVTMLTQGAADYMTKPFELRELLARIEVQLRLAGRMGSADGENAGSKENKENNRNDMLTCGVLALNPASHEVTAGGKCVHLTRTEYAILKLLMINSGQAVAKSVILDRISDDTPDCTEASLKQHISNLRRKLKDTCGDECVEAVWGIGFRLK